MSGGRYLPQRDGGAAWARRHRGESYTACGAAKGFVFRSVNATDSHHDVVTVSWELRRPLEGGEVAASGVALLVLDGEDRFRADYQFDHA